MCNLSIIESKSGHIWTCQSVAVFAGQPCICGAGNTATQSLLDVAILITTIPLSLSLTVFFRNFGKIITKHLKRITQSWGLHGSKLAVALVSS